MAPGIYKTFKKALRNNLKKYIEYTSDDEKIAKLTEWQINDILELEDDALDKILLVKPKYCSDKEIENAIKIIVNSIKDTERECYQAMEGIVHNLNTLHSRAGAQVSNVA